MRGQRPDEVEELEQRRNNKLKPVQSKDMAMLEGSVIQLDQDEVTMSMASLAPQVDINLGPKNDQHTFELDVDVNLPKEKK